MTKPWETEERKAYMKEYRRKMWEEDTVRTKETYSRYAKERRQRLIDELGIEEVRKREREAEAIRRSKNPLMPMLHDAKKRAKKKGLEFNITKEDIYIPSHCPVLGIPLEVSKGIRSDNSPSLDRVDNSKGYVRFNVRVISFKANAMKNENTVESLKALIKYIEDHENALVWD